MVLDNWEASENEEWQKWHDTQLRHFKHTHAHAGTLDDQKVLRL